MNKVAELEQVAELVACCVWDEADWEQKTTIHSGATRDCRCWNPGRRWVQKKDECWDHYCSQFTFWQFGQFLSLQIIQIFRCKRPQRNTERDKMAEYIHVCISYQNMWLFMWGKKKKGLEYKLLNGVTDSHDMEPECFPFFKFRTMELKGKEVILHHIRLIKLHVIFFTVLNTIL